MEWLVKTTDGRTLAVEIGQPADTVALEAAVQSGAGELRDRRLQGIEAIVERQERVAPEGDDE